MQHFFRTVGTLALLALGAAAQAIAAQSVVDAGCPAADAEALAWLDKMSRSSHEVDYRGVVTFQRGDDMQVMQIAHSVAGGSTSEQMTRLTGQGAQVERADHPLECLHPGHKLLQVGNNLQSGGCGIAQHYRFGVAEGERVAGRDAVRIMVEPRDMYRYGYVMELDRETALLLKTSTIGRGAKVLERFQFADLAYGQKDQSSAEVATVHRATHPNPGEAPAGQSVGLDWSPHWLPSGFTLTDAAAQGDRRRTYTDGLAAFSVFLEPLRGDIQPGEGMARQGSTTSYTRGMAVDGRPVLITVIGEVPVNTARMVADSVTQAR
ncbi:MAG: MucB/RseB C-terminal domain-containing protein [Halieaceae bacterium]